MKKLLCALLSMILCLNCASALAALVKPEISWAYPLDLCDVQSDYTMLVNADNLLDKSFKPDPEVKVTGIKRATSAAVYMEETAAEALKVDLVMVTSLTRSFCSL